MHAFDLLQNAGAAATLLYTHALCSPRRCATIIDFLPWHTRKHLRAILLEADLILPVYNKQADQPDVDIAHKAEQEFKLFINQIKTQPQTALYDRTIIAIYQALLEMRISHKERSKVYEDEYDQYTLDEAFNVNDSDDDRCTLLPGSKCLMTGIMAA